MHGTRHPVGNGTHQRACIYADETAVTENFCGGAMSSDNVSRLILAIGQNAAEARRASGGIWGQAISDISKVPGQVMAQRRADRALDSKQQQEQDRLQLDRQRETREASGAADEHAMRVQQLEAMRQKQASDWAEKLRLSNATPEILTGEVDAQIGKLWTPEEGAAIKQKVATPEGAAHFLTMLAPVREPKPPEPFTLKNADGSESRFNGPGGSAIATGNATPKSMTPAEQTLRDETARHNKEQERIAGLSAGRAEAAQQETARHNRVMETHSTDDQNKLEQEYRTVLARGLSSRSGGLGLEDAKVQQANHLLALMDQSYDPKTDSYNIPRVQQTELAMGLAKLVAPGGVVGVQMEKEINQRTAKGDLAGALTYLLGTPFNGTTQDLVKMYRDSIIRQGEVAQENREGEMRYLRGLAPTNLAEERRKALETTSLNPLRQSRIIRNTTTGERRLQISTDGGVTWK